MVPAVERKPFPELWNVDPGTSKSRFVRDVLAGTYGEIAPHFHRTRRSPWPETVKFGRNFGKGDRIVDMGCGNGRNAIYLAGLGLEVTGVDLSQDLLELAEENAGSNAVDHLCEFVRGDLTDLPFAEGEFQGGIYIASLHHLATHGERLLSLNELHRVLAPGARALISVWGREKKFHELLAIWEEHPLFEYGDVMVPWKSGDEEWPRYYHLFDEREFGSLLKESDLAVEDVFVSGENIYGRVRRAK